MPARAVLVWGALALAIAIPLGLATTSPWLEWRDPVYIAAGFAGILGLGLILLQPLLAAGYLPGLPVVPGRRLHRWIGVALVAMIVVHVVGLWITSPPDALDALLLRSPTPFSVWGVTAMWAAFAAAGLAALRGRVRLRPHVWRIGHTLLVAIVAVGTVVHALLIEGTMEPVSKAALCGLVLAATAKVVFDLRAWSLLSRGRGAANRS